MYSRGLEVSNGETGANRIYRMDRMKIWWFDRPFDRLRTRLTTNGD